MVINLDRLMGGGPGRKEKRRLPVSEARSVVLVVIDVPLRNSELSLCARNLTLQNPDDITESVARMHVFHRSQLEEAEADTMFPAEVINKEAIRLAEQDGCVMH